MMQLAIALKPRRRTEASTAAVANPDYRSKPHPSLRQSDGVFRIAPFNEFVPLAAKM
jgi:hypothetical protein